MSVGRLHALIWALIYGGLLVIVVGMAVHRTAPGIGAGAIVLGGVLALAGAVLVVVRSRTVGRITESVLDTSDLRKKSP
ncbi:MAG TPA: hypothetical protein VMU47_08585 [Caldimonas sp.]|nr:hypothetical protein [Caldimonas sp.]